MPMAQSAGRATFVETGEGKVKSTLMMPPREKSKTLKRGKFSCADKKAKKLAKREAAIAIATEASKAKKTAQKREGREQKKRVHLKKASAVLRGGMSAESAR